MKKYLALATVAAVLSLPACSYFQSQTPPGQYESSHSSVDRNGTEHDSTTKTNVYYDSNGVRHESTDTKNTTDPKGLFNKSTSESHSESAR